MSKVRQERTAELIQHLLSELFLREVSDPRVAGVTITDVEIDRELQYATAFVNALGDESREAEVMAGLQSAATSHALPWYGCTCIRRVRGKPGTRPTRCC